MFHTRALFERGKQAIYNEVLMAFSPLKKKTALHLQGSSVCVRACCSNRGTLRPVGFVRRPFRVPHAPSPIRGNVCHGTHRLFLTHVDMIPWPGYQQLFMNVSNFTHVQQCFVTVLTVCFLHMLT